MGQSKEKHIRLAPVSSPVCAQSLALCSCHQVTCTSAHAVKLRMHPGTMFCSGQLMMGAWWLICVRSRTCIGKSFEDTNILRADQFCYVSCHKKDSITSYLPPEFPRLIHTLAAHGSCQTALHVMWPLIFFC
jgi:hypothetical protein